MCYRTGLIWTRRIVEGEAPVGVLAPVSKVLCGARHRLPVAVWIHGLADGTAFWAARVAKGVGVASRYVGTELDRLEQLGMIHRQTPDRPGDIRRLYVTVPAHPLWAVVEAVEQAAGRLELETASRDEVSVAT